MCILPPEGAQASPQRKRDQASHSMNSTTSIPAKNQSARKPKVQKLNLTPTPNRNSNSNKKLNAIYGVF